MAQYRPRRGVHQHVGAHRDGQPDPAHQQHAAEVPVSDQAHVPGAERAGDVAHSLADITRGRRELGYQPMEDFRNGLEQTVAWYQSEAAKEQENEAVLA